MLMPTPILPEPDPIAAPIAIQTASLLVMPRQRGQIAIVHRAFRNSDLSNAQALSQPREAPMSPFLVMNVQSLLGLVAWGLIARWHVGPALKRWELEDALALLCLIHAFRYVALGVYAPGQISASLPPDPIALIVIGDVTSAILAILAAVALRIRAPRALLAAWIFNIVGIADIVMSMPLAIASRLYEQPLGFSWYVFTFYVPVLVVTHVMMLAWLIAHARGRMDAR
jgi:hypothetical protein